MGASKKELVNEVDLGEKVGDPFALSHPKSIALFHSFSMPASTLLTKCLEQAMFTLDWMLTRLIQQLFHQYPF